jgi:hypothetical protein
MGDLGGKIRLQLKILLRLYDISNQSLISPDYQPPILIAILIGGINNRI